MKIRSFLEKSISVFYAAVFAVCSFFTLFHFERYPLGFAHSTVKTGVFALLCGGLTAGYAKLLGGRTSRRSNMVRFAVALILAAVQFLLFLKILTPIGWDALEVNNSAEFGMYNEEYFVRYPNNLFMQMMLSGWLKVLKFIPFLSALRKMELLNLFFVDAAIAMAVLTVRKLYGTRAGDSVFAGCVLLIGFHPTLSTVYSDTLAMPFPIGVLFFLVCAGRADAGRKKLLYVSMAGIWGVTGYYIKPTVCIIYIAMAVILLLRMKRNALNREILMQAAAGLLCASLAFGAIWALQRPIKAGWKEKYPEIVSVGPLHYIGMGLSNLEDDPSGYGGWNEPAVTWTQQHIGSPDYTREAIEHIRERLADYGPLGYLEQLFNKLVWAGSDGTFFYGMEGGFHLEEQSDRNTLRGFLQNGFYIETEFYQNWFSAWMQGVWLMVCIRSALTILRKSDAPYSGIAKLSVLGLFLFLLLFENRSRYLFLYLPVILTIAESGCFLIIRANPHTDISAHGSALPD